MHLGGLASMDGDPSHYNVVAALPSMHAAFPALALIVVLRHRLPRLVVGLVAFQFLSVMFSIVYTGEHYVVDAIAGAAYAGLAYALVCRGLDHLPRPRAEAPPSAAGVPDTALAVERA
jgi:membrane-associated phospholipid phosphatase